MQESEIESSEPESEDEKQVKENRKFKIQQNKKSVAKFHRDEKCNDPNKQIKHYFV